MENRVGFGKRLGALLLDCVIVFVLMFVLGGVVGGMLGMTAGAMGASGSGSTGDAAAAAGMIGAALGMIAAGAVIGLVYFLLEGFTGYTIGKLLLGIRIANADGSQASVGKLLERWAVKNINFIMVLLALFTGISAFRMLGNLGGLLIFVGCFLALGASRQALHDRIVSTAVYPKNMVRAAA